MPAVIKPRSHKAPRVTGSPHALKRNTVTGRPISLLFLDTETEIAYEFPGVQWQRFRLGVTCYYRRRYGGREATEIWADHKSPESVCQEIEARARGRTVLYVFASNPSFDLWVLKFYTWFSRRGWKASFIYDEGLRFILVCRREKEVLKILALQNYYPLGIAAVGKELGLEKIECEPLNASEKELFRYCRRDVEILKRAVLEYIDFCDTANLGGWALTLSGQAWNALCHRFLKTRVWVHKNEKTLALERAAYFGGRVEAYELGSPSGGPFVKLDVNSMYPYVMLMMPYPINYEQTWVAPPLDFARIVLNNYCVVADVTLQTDVPLWPTIIQGRTCFPIGTFRAQVCTGGLLTAFELGAVRQVHRLVMYKRGALFRGFIAEFWKRRSEYRQQGKNCWSLLVKRLMNSLYGRFGMAPPVLIEKKQVADSGFYRELYIPADGGETKEITLIMHTMFVNQGRHEGKHSMPAVAAHVTEYARLHLAEILNTLGWDRALYCDTDSVFLRATDLGRLHEHLDPETLGKLKVEQEIKRLTIYGPKDYVVDGKRTIKGVPEKAEQVGKHDYRCEVFPGIKTLFATPKGTQIPLDSVNLFSPRQLLDFQGEGLYPVLRQVKHLERIYRKGDVQANGKVKPYRLSDSRALTPSTLMRS